MRIIIVSTTKEVCPPDPPVLFNICWNPVDTLEISSENFIELVCSIYSFDKEPEVVLFVVYLYYLFI